MPKRFLIPLFMLAAALLAACQGRSVAPAETPTATPVPATATPTPAPPGCTVTSMQPTPNPTLQAIFAPVSDDDWVIGPASAQTTLIEYSDFQ